MASVAIITTKGGAGKSTIAANLAIAAKQDGKHVLLIDGDASQNSLHMWVSAMRMSEPPEVRCADSNSFEASLLAAESEGYDIIIVDAPPGDGALVRKIASLVDHIIVPVRASAFDIMATRQTIELLKFTTDRSRPEAIAQPSAFHKAKIVLNGAPSRITPKWEKDIDGALVQCGAAEREEDIEVAGILKDRAVYRTSIAQGRGVVERSAKDAASKEVNELYENVLTLMDRRAVTIERGGPE